jgi:long-subunit fatty acid transport protein
MKTVRIFWLIIAVTIGLQGAYAQLIEDALRYSQLGLGVGARQLGMGNAAVGGVDDYSALFWNPAGLALIRDYELSFGMTRSRYSDEVSYFDTKTNSNKDVFNLNNLGIVYPIPTVQGSLTFAFGFNRAANYTTLASMDAFNPYSSVSQSIALLSQPLDNNIPYQLYLANLDTNGRLVPIMNGNIQQTIDILEGGGLNHWSFGGAIEIGRNLSLGISLNYASGSYSYSSNFVENDLQNYYTVSPNDISRIEYQSTYDDDITGFNALFGLMFRKPGKYSIGIAFRTPTIYDISETFTELASSKFKTPDINGYDFYTYPSASYPDPASTSIKYKVTTPYVMSMGVSIQPSGWLLLAGDLEYTDWTQMEMSLYDVKLVSKNMDIKNLFQATTNLRAGAEVSLQKLGIKLRGGIIDNPSPWKGDPSSRDQLYYTGGIGFMLDENATINAAYAYGTWKTTHNNYSYTDARGYTQDVGTNETVTTSTLNITFSYKF